MRGQDGITVRRALELPGLRGGLPETVACADGLDRTVRWVHAGEVPHIASLLKGGELLLTTGLGLGTRPAEHRAFVRRLADRGIAALVVELGSRFERLPAALVEAARDAGLPLVQLHREVPFVSVTEEIHTEIVNGHYALLRRAEEVHRQCTAALLDGGGVPRVLHILAGFAGNPVFLETADGQVLFAAAPPGSGTSPGTLPADPLQIWQGLRGSRAARAQGPPAGTVVVDVPGGGPAPGDTRARLVIPAVGAPLREVHRMAADRAAAVLAVVLMQARQEDEVAARGRGDFLTDLAEGRVLPGEAPAQAAVLGFRPGEGPLLPVVMRPATGTAPAGVWASLARAVLEELSSVGVPVLLGVRPVEGRVPLLAGLRAESERTAVADRVAQALRAGLARAGLEHPGADRPVIVVGVPGGWAAAGAGLRHAAETAAAARGLGDRPWHDARRLDIDLLLWRLRGQPDLAAFVDRTIGPLLAGGRSRSGGWGPEVRGHPPEAVAKTGAAMTPFADDRGPGTPLLATLEAYLAHAGRKAETARDLHLNRQTLYNRLARIEELLGTDLADPQTALVLNLALRARRYLS